MTEAPRFPIFISLYGMPVLVVGGGKVAARRVRVLLEFGAVVTIVSPEICDELRSIEQVEWRKERYSGLSERYAGLDERCSGHNEHYTLIIAATNERETNYKVGMDAHKAGIPVSVADAPAESSFWFPAIVKNNGIIAGLVSENCDHRAVKTVAGEIRKLLSAEGEEL